MVPINTRLRMLWGGGGGLGEGGKLPEALLSSPVKWYNSTYSQDCWEDRTS